MNLDPEKVFGTAFETGTSDVHMAVGAPIMFRVDGVLAPQMKTNLTKADMEGFIKTILGAKRMDEFKEEMEMDASYALKNGIRIRINCMYDQKGPGLVGRLIPPDIPSLEDLRLTEIFETVCDARDGLILFTGPTGTGKSTSLAAIINHMNQTRPAHIVTLEDPIEFKYPEGQALIRQRQMEDDFKNFPEALRRVLRQDPDIVLVGEMRDLETIGTALTLAETGHLIFGTLHTPNAAQTVDRIIDVFPPHQQQQVRMQLSLSLRGVVAQRLLPAADGGRTAQREVLINTMAVANIIREGRTQELISVMQTSQKTSGMKTFEKAAEELLEAGLIDKEIAEWAAQGA